jgi:hypothetical protein
MRTAYKEKSIDSAVQLALNPLQVDNKPGEGRGQATGQ